MKTNFSYLKVSAVVLVFPFALLSFIIATLGYASDMGYANLLERACCGLAAAVYLLYFIPNRVIAQNRHITYCYFAVTVLPVLVMLGCACYAILTGPHDINLSVFLWFSLFCCAVFAQVPLSLLLFLNREPNAEQSVPPNPQSPSAPGFGGR